MYHMENTRTQFTIPGGDGEPRNFFQEYRTKSTSAQASSPQASSLKPQAHKPQATGDKLPILRLQAGGWAHKLQAL